VGDGRPFGKNKLSSTLVTKTAASRIFFVTFRAFHYPGRSIGLSEKRITIKKKRVKLSDSEKFSLIYIFGYNKICFNNFGQKARLEML